MESLAVAESLSTLEAIIIEVFVAAKRMAGYNLTFGAIQTKVERKLINKPLNHQDLLDALESLLRQVRIVEHDRFYSFIE